MNQGQINLIVMQRLNRISTDPVITTSLANAFIVAHREIQMKVLKTKGNFRPIITLPLSGAAAPGSLGPQGLAINLALGVQDIIEIQSVYLTKLSGNARVPIQYYNSTTFEVIQDMTVNHRDISSFFYAMPGNNSIYLYPPLTSEQIEVSTSNPYALEIRYWGFVPEPSPAGSSTDFFMNYGYNYIIYRMMREVCLDYGYTKEFEDRIRVREDEALKDFLALEVSFFNHGPTRMRGGSF